MLSITTDFVQSTGDPSPYLRLISEAGFSHIHWCHEWNSDHYYEKDEIIKIQNLLRINKLHLNDLHSTEGVHKYWLSPVDENRNAGIELVKNRINLAARLGSDVIIQHVGPEPVHKDENKIFWERLKRSLDQVETYATAHGVKLAFENLYKNHTTLIKILDTYPPEFAGLCLDSGHANMEVGTFDLLEPYVDRLISIHLHDNDGYEDQHKLPFTGTVDWEKIIGFISRSDYQKSINLEVGIQESGFNDAADFLESAKAIGEKLTLQLTLARNSN